MNRYLKYLLIPVIAFLALSSFAKGQQLASNDSTRIDSTHIKIKNPEGNDFWVCFEKNYKDDATQSNELHLELFVTCDKDARIEINIDGIRYKKKFFVAAKTVLNIKLPAEAQVRSEEIRERLAVHITSDNPISVYGLNRRFQTTDTYLALPTDVLGTEYRAMCYRAQDDLLPEFAVIATEDQTEVTITPKVNTLSRPAGIPFKVNLSRGDVYQVAAKREQLMRDDLTGSLIVANKKIAVFSGHQCAYVPANIIACNHLVEEMPPIPSWGKHFYIGRLMSRSYYSYRVLANEANTRVFEDARLVKTLGPGEYYENTTNKNIQITADKPILVAQYSQGLRNGDNVGDPMMILVSPTQQFLMKYRFATPISGNWKHFVNVVVPNRGIKSMMLDGKPIDPKLFEQLGLSRYSIAYIRVPYGTHTLDGAMPFGMYSYGFGEGDDAFDAYGTMGGQSFMAYEPALDTLPPVADLQLKEGVYELIFRDDRVDDTGLREIKVLESQMLNTKPGKLDPGSPQSAIMISVDQPGAEGRLLVEATDIALNKSTYTVCYAYNPSTDKIEMNLSEGNRKDCSSDPGFQLGAFIKVAINFHSADFRYSGNMYPGGFLSHSDSLTKGKFAEATGNGGYAGISFGRKISPNWLLTARLMFENYSGTLQAPDDSILPVRATDGSLKNFQESRSLTLNGLFMNIGLGAEYYLSQHFYVDGSLAAAMPLSKSVTLTKNILIPADYTYLDNSRSMTDPKAASVLESISTRFALGLGGGFIYTFNRRLSAFIEVDYSYPLSSVLSDANWKISQLMFLGGIRFRI